MLSHLGSPQGIPCQSSLGLGLPITLPGQARRHSGRIFSKIALRSVLHVSKRHVWRSVPEKLLQPDNWHAGLSAVHTEGVAKVVDRRIGAWNTCRVSTTVVELGRKASPPKEPSGSPVVTKRERKDGVGWPAGHSNSVRSEKLAKRVGDRHVSGAPPRLESSALVAYRQPAIRETHIPPRRWVRTHRHSPGGETESPASTKVKAGEDVPECARRDSNARPLAPEGRQPEDQR